MLSLLSAAALLLSACGGGGAGTPITGEGAGPLPPALSGAQIVPDAAWHGKIKHVVIIIQENRSFDDLFTGFPGLTPGTDTPPLDKNGKPYGLATRGYKCSTCNPPYSYSKHPELRKVPLSTWGDIWHAHGAYYLAYDGGKMDGFNLEQSTNPERPYTYIDPSTIAPYFTLAQQYTLAARMFQSNTGPSFPAHLYLIAGQSQRIFENPSDANEPLLLQSSIPWGCDAPPGTAARQFAPSGPPNYYAVWPCVNMPTLADRLDAKGLNWRYYAPQMVKGTGGNFGKNWSTYDAIAHIRCGSFTLPAAGTSGAGTCSGAGRDWRPAHIISPETAILTDVHKEHLAAVTWIVPKFSNSDHPPSAPNATMGGPDWVGNVVDAIGNGPDWSSTAIFIVWDDWGGFYEHVKPPYVDYMGDGFRVPMIVVSPYARHGYVSRVTHDFGSILHFTEKTFALQSLGTRDARADDLHDCFNFAQRPGKFVPVAVTRPGRFFIDQPADDQPPDSD